MWRMSAGPLTVALPGLWPFPLFPAPLPPWTLSDTCFWVPWANKSTALTARKFYKEQLGFKVVGSSLAPRHGNEKGPRNVPRRTAAGGSEGREARAGGRLRYHPGKEGGNEMSWLLLPAPCPLGSPSKAAKGPPLQEWGWERRREVHWFLECFNATLLLECSLLLSNSRL